MSELPVIAGRTVSCSLDTYKLRAKTYLEIEQNKLHPDNGLIAILCDAVRLAREYEDYVKEPDNE